MGVGQGTRRPDRLRSVVAGARPCVGGNPAANRRPRCRAARQGTLVASGADGVPGVAQAHLGTLFTLFWARGYFCTRSGNITDAVILPYPREHEPPASAGSC